MTAAAPSLTEGLASLLLRPVDSGARQRAGALVTDWLGCAVGARRSPLATKLTAVVATLPAGQVTAIGAGQRDAASALLVNAALGNVLEMDDVHRGAILHAGPVVIPVALAVAESTGATPQQFLDAVVRGYEATIRVGRALGRGHYRYWHPTSTAGAFGAAAAAGSILGLNAEALADALGTAGSRTGGLWQMRHEPVPTKSIHNAETARSGLLAAQLAAAGLRGPRAILEGVQGLFAATAPDAQPELVLAEAPDWLIHTTSLKPWPACRHAHPAIDAMRDALRESEDLPIEAIVSIEVTTYAEALRFCDRPNPASELEAKFSLQHALAAIACLGRPQLDHYLPTAIENPKVRAMRARVTVLEDAEASARFPDHYGAAVTVTLADGRRLHASRVDAWGDPECPMSDAEIAAKALGLAKWGGVSAEAATRLFDAVRSLPTARSMESLQAALAGLDA
ncbi:MAG TPA: MmgE/PrpD family protein [Thauera sp.]|nr:MmgE/PrpD family protein [Thauera sp.]